MALVGSHPEFRWLTTKPEILDELGRIDADHALLVMAKRLCDLKPHTNEAIEMIARHREFNQLADEVIHVVNDYFRRHPTTSRAEVLRALETAALLLGTFDEASKPGRHQFLQKARSPRPAPTPKGMNVEAR